MRWQRRPVLLAAIAMLTVGVVAVGVRAAAGGDGSAGTSDGPAVRLRATAEQWRTHEVNREIAVALHNDGDVPVRVSRIDPVLPSFQGATGVDTDALLPPGGLRVDVPVPFGTGGCVGAAAASRVVVVARPDGATTWQRVTLPLPDPNPLLDRLLAVDCATQRVRQSVTLQFGPWRDAGGAGVRGSLVVDRTTSATGAVQVTDLDGNVMYRFTFAGRTTPLGRVTAAAPHVEVPFTAQPARCDLHAFAETKKPFEFPVRVSLDGGTPLATTVPVDTDDRTALDRMLRRNCGVPPS